MAFASGGYHGTYTIPEAVFGTTPTNPDWDPLPHVTDCSLQLKRDKFESKALRSDRAITDVRLGTYKVEGDLGFELCYSEFDELLEGRDPTLEVRGVLGAGRQGHQHAGDQAEPPWFHRHLREKSLSAAVAVFQGPAGEPGGTPDVRPARRQSRATDRAAIAPLVTLGR